MCWVLTVQISLLSNPQLQNYSLSSDWWPIQNIHSYPPQLWPWGRLSL